MIYRVTIYGYEAEHQQYEYFGSRAAARERVKDARDEERSLHDGELMTEIDREARAPHTRSEVIALLNLWASHADNG